MSLPSDAMPQYKRLVGFSNPTAELVIPLPAAATAPATCAAPPFAAGAAAATALAGGCAGTTAGVDPAGICPAAAGAAARAS